MDSSIERSINSFKQEKVDFENFEENMQVEQNDVDVKEEIFDGEETTENVNTFINEDLEDPNNDNCNKNLGTKFQESESMRVSCLEGWFIVRYEYDWYFIRSTRKVWAYVGPYIWIS